MLICTLWSLLSPEAELNVSCSGPLISPAAKKRVTGLISSAEQDGGEIVLDGRNVSVPGYPDGNFVGPTIIKTGLGKRAYE